MSYFLRFLTLVFSMVFSLLLVWFGLYTYGQKTTHGQFQTKLLEKLQKEGFPINWEEAPSALNGSEPLKHPFVTIRTHFRDGMWKTMWNTEEIRLQEAYGKLVPEAITLLFLEAPGSDALPSLRKFLQQDNLGLRTIICSRADGLLRDLRQLEPAWTYCSGEIYMTRLLALSSIYLEGLSRISADVMFIHLENMSLSPSVAPLIDEAKRQNKAVFIGPVTFEDYQAKRESYQPDGWVILPKTH